MKEGTEGREGRQRGSTDGRPRGRWRDIVKDESKGTLATLAFYGYVQDEYWAQECDHRAPAKMYLSKNLDMLSAPHTYRRRGMGEDGMQRPAQALHRGAAVTEHCPAHRTHLPRSPRPKLPCSPTPTWNEPLC